MRRRERPAEDASLAIASISIKIPEAAKKQQEAREEQHMSIARRGGLDKKLVTAPRLGTQP